MDENGNLVLFQETTFYKVKDLERITYRDIEGVDFSDFDDAYIHFKFGMDDHLYLRYDHEGYKYLGDDFQMIMEGHEIYNDAASKLLFREWTREGDYLIGKEGTLFAYLGKEKEVVLPNKVKKIGGYAFYSAKSVEHVICSDELIEICDSAFMGYNSLKEIDLKNVEIIGKHAFRGRELTRITIPSSVKKIGEEAFYYCDEQLINNITNNSAVVIDDTIVKTHNKK